MEVVSLWNEFLKVKGEEVVMPSSKLGGRNEEGDRLGDAHLVAVSDTRMCTTHFRV